MVKNLVLLFFIFTVFQLAAQRRCSMEEYAGQQVSKNPLLKSRLDEIEVFTQQKINEQGDAQRTNRIMTENIKVPVVVHVLYHTPDQNIPASTIENIIASLNRDFARKNADTLNTPAVFKPFASAMGIEFKLATMDPGGVGTNGIVRKYTPITYWYSDDKMKFSSTYGDDAWDSKSYLNIWICTMKDVLGYSTFPGMNPLKDGVVLSVQDFYLSSKGTSPGVNDNRTAVHEVGHWLNLKHIWGEGYCGDDGVDDTPRQSTYTPGCPSGIRVSCGNNISGDMYMNYMDFTDDACMNMFTKGQRERAAVLFETGGPRNSILNSKGLNISSIDAAPLPDFYPRWLSAKIYPNPATSFVNIYCEYDERWIGREMYVADMAGKKVISKIITSKIQRIDVSRLPAGIYYICAEKEQEKLHAKFVKL